MPTTASERLDAQIAEAYSELKTRFGGHVNDYYGLVFLENVLGISRDQALQQLALGGGDLGIDGFFVDVDEGAFRILQFKNTRSTATLTGSMERLASVGVPALFDSRPVADVQPVVDAARRAFANARSAIRRLLVDFVFRGDPDEAERREALKALRERIEEHSWRLEEFVGQPASIEVRFLNFDGLRAPTPRTELFPLRLSGASRIRGPGGVEMHVGFVPLFDLLPVHQVLGRRLFEQNIRFALPPDGHVNRALDRALRDCFVGGTADPSGFAFSHNGITLSVQAIEQTSNGVLVKVPRLLNGAQTISTMAAFAQRFGSVLQQVPAVTLDRLQVLCRIIVAADRDFVTRVTIDTNRQNPVEPWLLRANDDIQLRLADRFREIGIFYQRQGNAFAGWTIDEREADGIGESRPIELVKLARTFLAAEGNITKLVHIRDVFEDDKSYKNVFNHDRLTADPRVVVLCYKMQARLGLLTSAIRDKGPNKYYFVPRAREMVWSLLCQALLNDGRLSDHADRFGESLTMQTEYVELLHRYATTRVQPLLRAVIELKEYASKVEEGNLTFLRTSAAFDRAMVLARREYDWRIQRLR